MSKLSKYLGMTLGCGILAAAPLIAPSLSPRLSTSSAIASPTKSTPLLVTARVTSVAKVPRAGSTPYKDAVIALRLANVRATNGKWTRNDVLVYAWGMRDRKNTKAATLRPGQTVRLTLVPWKDVERSYGRYNRWEIDGDAVMALPVYWGELK